MACWIRLVLRRVTQANGLPGCLLPACLRLVCVKWPWERPLSLCLQPLLVAVHKDQKGDDDERGQYGAGDGDRACQPVNAITEVVASQTKQRSPHNSTQSVEEQKAGPAHPIRPGQERGPCPQYSDKAPKEDDLAAVLHEEVLPQLQLAFIQTNIVTVAAQETVAAHASNYEAEVITQDSATGSSHDHQQNG